MGRNAEMDVGLAKRYLCVLTDTTKKSSGPPMFGSASLRDIALHIFPIQVRLGKFVLFPAIRKVNPAGWCSKGPHSNHART